MSYMIKVRNRGYHDNNSFQTPVHLTLHAIWGHSVNISLVPSSPGKIGFDLKQIATQAFLPQCISIYPQEQHTKSISRSEVRKYV